jgi:YHS domain-containing protein
MKSVNAIVATALIALSTVAFAAMGEFADNCAYGMSMGKAVKTDCSVAQQIGGKNYCFSSEEAKATFMKEQNAMLAKAQDNWTKLTK